MHIPVGVQLDELSQSERTVEPVLARRSGGSALEPPRVSPFQLRRPTSITVVILPGFSLI